MYRTLIDRVPFLSTYDQLEVDELVSSTRPFAFSAGDVMINTEGPHDRFFIILDGEVEVISILGEQDEPHRTVRGPGDFVGESGLLAPESRGSMAVYAINDVRAIELHYRDLTDMLERKPNLVFGLLRQMMLQVRESDNDVILTLKEKNKQLSLVNEKLKTAQTEILGKEEMDRELQVARRIQKGILPGRLPVLSGYDFGVRMAQARMVGGDFFDFIPLGRDTLGIAIGDVSDKGVPASIFMAATRSLLRAEAHAGILPRHVLQRVNYHLMDMNEAGLFVTVLYGVLNAVEGTFTYARAGHELPLFFDLNCTADCIEQNHGQALGIFAAPVFDENRIVFSPESVLLLNTDGVTDAINIKGEAFGIERLRKVVMANKDTTAQAICDMVIEAVTAFIGTTPQFDDLTLVGIKSA